LNFYKRFIGDYIRDTAHLSMLEHGAYTMLLDAYYATEKPFPNDMNTLYRICRAVKKEEKVAVFSVISQFFKLSAEGFYFNSRADIEIDRKLKQVNTNRELGRKGGRPPVTETDSQNKTESVSETKPNNNPSHSHSQKEQKKSAYALPDWVPLDAWNSYVEMRQKIRRPLTEKAKYLQVKKLAELVNEGQDPEAVLNNSVANSWQGLFPVKSEVKSKGVAL